MLRRVDAPTLFNRHENGPSPRTARFSPQPYSSCRAATSSAAALRGLGATHRRNQIQQSGEGHVELRDGSSQEQPNDVLTTPVPSRIRGLSCRAESSLNVTQPPVASTRLYCGDATTERIKDHHNQDPNWIDRRKRYTVAVGDRMRKASGTGWHENPAERPMQRSVNE